MFEGDILDRVILHSDLNGFYASVECLYNPDIRDKPVAVCGSVEQRHGIVLAKNEHAKKFNIKTGEAIWQAKQKCPELIVINPNFERYVYFSRAARGIYERYTDRVESFGLDECWLDVTGSAKLYGSGEKIAKELRRVIKSELGLTVSVGVSWNKIYAKLGSDIKKPDAHTVITRDNYKEIVWPLSASDLLYVGPATTRRLKRCGIFTIGDIALSDVGYLKRLLGKWGETLWLFANGYDNTPVATSDSPAVIKSIGNSMTIYRDIENEEEAKNVITALSESVAKRLRQNGFYGKTVQISLRDNKLQFSEHQGKLTAPTFISEEIAKTAFNIFKSNYNWQRPLRSMGVRVCDLVSNDTLFQLDMFGSGQRRDKLERLEFTVDKLRSRFGDRSVLRASLLYDDLTGADIPLIHTIHPISYMR